jgi:hypothetical protein
VAPVAVAAESPNPAKPASEGIKVHGLWVIDVKNPDGTLAEHRVFENSLQDSNTLVGLLGGYYVAGDFGIRLGYQTSPSICPTSSCYIVQSTTTQLGTDVCGAGNCQLGLTKTVNLYNGVGAPTAPSLVLAGQYTALQTGTVGQVGTNIGRCGSAAGPAYHHSFSMSFDTVWLASCQRLPLYWHLHHADPSHLRADCPG